MQYVIAYRQHSSINHHWGVLDLQDLYFSDYCSEICSIITRSAPLALSPTRCACDFKTYQWISFHFLYFFQPSSFWPCTFLVELSTACIWAPSQNFPTKACCADLVVRILSWCSEERPIHMGDCKNAQEIWYDSVSYKMIGCTRHNPHTFAQVLSFASVPTRST